MQVMIRWFVLGFLIPAGGMAYAQESPPREITDLQALMSAEDYDKAGLEKLTPAERAHLETWLNAYLAGEKEKAAEAAAEQAVEEKVAEIRETTERNFGFFGFLDRDDRVPEEMKEPAFIESAIPGEFRGWSDGERIQLENGQVWEVDGRRYFMVLANPKVRIEKGSFGGHFLRLVDTGKRVRVSRVK
ncbi:MAG: hypothetical protein ACFE0O_00090 [Opitutales bacterium]